MKPCNQQYILLLFLGSSYTYLRVSSCVLTTTCIGFESDYPTTSSSILYPFDGNTGDANLVASGSAMGTFSLPTYFVGSYAGQAIFLNISHEHYVRIPSIDFKNQSFTLEMWILPLDATSVGSSAEDFSIFGQCSTDNICLTLSFRSGRIHLSFDSLSSNQTLISSTIIPIEMWTHIAVVYDIIVFQQRIYINGDIDTLSMGIVMPYQGSSANTFATIGQAQSAAYLLTTFYG